MFIIGEILSIEEDSIPEVAKQLGASDISILVDCLSLKEDNIRYKAFLILKSRSAVSNDVYCYWDVFKEKLSSDNSYQRSIGAMLISENIKWDINDKFDGTADEYFNILNDEKPITVRQCLQALVSIVTYKPKISEQLAEKLISLDLTLIKETMRKLILIDILTVLSVIRKNIRTEKIEQYILKALTGEFLDKKAKKQIELLL